MLKWFSRPVIFKLECTSELLDPQNAIFRNSVLAGLEWGP